MTKIKPSSGFAEELLRNGELNDLFEREPSYKCIKQERTYLLNIYENKPPILANSIVSTSSCLLGMSGMGKTWALADILEELADVGASFSVMDNEGDLQTVSEEYDVEVMRLETNYIKPEKIRRMAITAVIQQKRIIIGFSPIVTQETRRFFVWKYAQVLFEIADKLHNMGKAVPHLFVLDESHLFIPQRYSEKQKYISELVGLMATIANMGRKRGLGILFASTRSARCNKDVLSQVRVKWLMRAVEKSDLESYKAALRSDENIDILYDVMTIVPSLKVGQAVYIPDGARGSIVKFRWRNSRHISKTPTLEDSGKVRELDAEDFI